MKCPKVFAVYLPQYHRTPHNDKWWGEGFTDWKAVKLAEPLFDGHHQPHIPYGGYYYDLLDKKTMINQATIAKEYGVDGFIFYHYYFGEGRMELERPAENLLKWKDIDMPFCFSWANQSWIRTWSKFAGNVWGEKFESGEDANDDGILVEQKYGDRGEWERHFSYLLPFFNDSRYIKIKGCPVFIIYSPSSIACIKDMIKTWRRLASLNGIKDIYFIGYNSYVNNAGFDALMMSEPTFSIRKLNKIGKIDVKNGVRCIDYKDFFENTIASLPADGRKTFFTCACGYDTSPRRGKRSECIINRSPELFEKYLTELLQKSLFYGNEFIAINAWNEWGEGMYLEPDEEDGYRYLESIRNAKEKISGMNKGEIDSICDIIDKYGVRENEQEFLLGKYQFYYKICSKWIDLLKCSNRLFKHTLDKDSIKSVAIYGFADIGRKLFYQLREEKIDVRYAIDQYVASITDDIVVYRPEEELPDVDAVIVTAYEPDEIIERLSKKMKCKMFSILVLLDKNDEVKNEL